MKTLFSRKLIICFLSLMATPIHGAIMSREYIQWSKGEFEIPAEIKKATEVTGLQPFLDSKREFTRMAAVRQLGEIDGPNAIGQLVDVFNKEPARKGRHVFPLVKLEVIRTLGTINTEQAMSALLGILKDYWERGPDVKDKKDFQRLDRDFAGVVRLLLETLYSWSGDPQVFKTAESIALSKDVREFYKYPHGIGQRAWEIYLKGEMTNKGIVEEEDSGRYLLHFVDDIGPLHIDPMGLGPVKVAAAHAILNRHSDAALSYLITEFEAQFKKEPRDSNGSFTERHNILRRKTGMLKHILRKKKEKQEK